LDKGFFVVLVKRRGTADGSGAGWKAEPVHATPGWAVTSGETLDSALRLQKEQYDARVAMNKPVPELVGARGGPMASGQTVRFVAVGKNL
jgi:hypothetical protein